MNVKETDQVGADEVKREVDSKDLLMCVKMSETLQLLQHNQLQFVAYCRAGKQELWAQARLKQLLLLATADEEQMLRRG